MEKVDKLLAWMREDKNLENIRTVSTITLIIIFVLYFYGFRTGFQFRLENITDLVIDIFIFIISAIMIISDFTLRGISAAMNRDDETREKLIKQHRELTEDVNEITLGERLNEYNKEQKLVEQEKEKQKLIKHYEMKKRKSSTRDDKKAKKKIKLYDQEIKKISMKSYSVKIKYKNILLDDVLNSNVHKKDGDTVDVNYSPYADVMKSQSGMVVATVLLSTILRFALEPSLANLLQAGIFLSVLIPFLTIRALISYQMARYNVEHKYPQSLQRQVNILKWCLNK